MEIDIPGPGGDPAALHHQIEGGQTADQRRDHRQESQLGLENPLLGTAQAGEGAIGEAGALTETEQQAGSQADHPLGQKHAQQQLEGGQPQHREGQIQPHKRIPLAEGSRQQGRQPQAPAAGQRRGGGGESRREGDAQGDEGSNEQGDQQPGRQPQRQQRRQIEQHREARDHLAAERGPD